MISKISLIIGIAVTALAFGIPTAFGERQLVAPPVPDSVAYFYANERATLGFGPIIHDHGDASQAKLQLQSPPMEVIRDRGDASQAKLQLQSPPMEVIRDRGDASQAKLVEQGSGTVGSREQVASSGSEIAWPQLGIGFGLGILLVAALWLAMRMTKSRPLAH
jgi:hypothetical protein